MMACRMRQGSKPAHFVNSLLQGAFDVKGYRALQRVALNSFIYKDLSNYPVYIAPCLPCITRNLVRVKVVFVSLLRSKVARRKRLRPVDYGLIFPCAATVYARKRADNAMHENETTPGPQGLGVVWIHDSVRRGLSRAPSH